MSVGIVNPGIGNVEFSRLTVGTTRGARLQVRPASHELGKILPTTGRYRVGLLSDTHGLLRPEALAFLKGCDLIVHGGDIGHAGILDILEGIAPVIVVRGNNDQVAWAEHIRETELFTVNQVRFIVIHDLSRLDLALLTSGTDVVDVVVSGHSHKPAIERKAGVLYINPGSCGPRRFKLPLSIGELTVASGVVDARVVELPGAQVLSRL